MQLTLVRTLKDFVYSICNIQIFNLGIDTNHIEFSTVSGVNREVKNIFNAYGSVTNNTDFHGHGTHCAGKNIKLLFR